MLSKHDDIAALVSGELDAEAVAAKHRASLEQVAVWKEVFLAGMRSAEPRRRSLLRRGPLLRLGGLGAVALVMLGSREAFSGDCPKILPDPLITLCPNRPAKAEDVNSNFLNLTRWLEKTGAGASKDITTAGAISATKISASGAVSALGKPVLLDVTTCVTGSLGGPCCPDGYSQDGQDLEAGSVCPGLPQGFWTYLCRRYSK